MTDTMKSRIDAFLADAGLHPTPIWEHAFIAPMEIPFSADVRAR